MQFNLQFNLLYDIKLHDLKINRFHNLSKQIRMTISKVQICKSRTEGKIQQNIKPKAYNS